MYLSRIELDPARRTTMTALTAPQKIHGAIEAAFPGERSRKLWRIDAVGGRLWLLLLSEESADLSGIAAQFGPAEAPCVQTRPYEPLLQRIEPGGVWRFRLTANPTKSCPANSAGAPRGVVRAHCTAEYQKQWLLQRAEKHGFRLEPEQFTVVRSQWYRFYKNGAGPQPVSLLAVTYEGVLQVTDAALFCKALTGGLGRGKAYGLGLLTVMHGGTAHA